MPARKRPRPAPRALWMDEVEACHERTSFSWQALPTSHTCAHHHCDDGGRYAKAAEYLESDAYEDEALRREAEMWFAWPGRGVEL